VRFNRNSGDISVPAVDPANAIPTADAGLDTMVSVKDTIRLHGSAADNFGGRIVKWEWYVEGLDGFVQSSTGDTAPAGDAAPSGDAHIGKVSQDEQDYYLPITVRDQTIATARFRKPSQEGKWNEEDMRVLHTLTDQLGVALESARLYQETQRRAARERMVANVTGKMRESLDMEAVLRTATTEIRQALGLEALTIRLTAPDTHSNDQSAPGEAA